MRCHRHFAAIRQYKLRIAAEFLDETENIVPTTAVLADDVVLQLIQYFIDFERGENGFDQHGDLDFAFADHSLFFRKPENIVPQSGFEMRLELRQIEIRAGAAALQLTGVVIEIESEVDQARWNRPTVDQHMILWQVPAARTHDQRGRNVVQRVVLAFGIQLYAAIHSIAQVDLPFNNVGPRGRQGILAIRHEDTRTGIQCIDDHFAVGGPGDFDAAVTQILRYAANFPLRFAYLACLREEIGHLSVIDGLLSFVPQCQ
jgi:hypothetical protein